MADIGGLASGMEALDDLRELQQRLAALEKGMSTLLLRFGEQEQELLNLSQIVMALQDGAAAESMPASGATPAAAAPTPVPPAPAVPAERIALTPEMGNVLKLIHAGQADEAKKALAAIPAEERNKQPAVLAIAAAALCIARDDYKNAFTALGKARQLTDDPRLLRIIELVGQKVPPA
jgi:hypothetical protein